MSRLPPAYRGAPYYQPSLPPGWRRHQAIRRVLLAVAGAIIVMLLVFACSSLASVATI
jgi:hypothetical protein